jgi:hypothetical protein
VNLAPITDTATNFWRLRGRANRPTNQAPATAGAYNMIPISRRLDRTEHSCRWADSTGSAHHSNHEYSDDDGNDVVGSEQRRCLLSLGNRARWQPEPESLDCHTGSNHFEFVAFSGQSSKPLDLCRSCSVLFLCSHNHKFRLVNRAFSRSNLALLLL